ncbi:MAG: sugar-binding protein, partial [Armatimonadota bacterium]
MFVRIARGLLVAACLIFAILPTSAVTIDGQFNDWAEAVEYDMPQAVAEAAKSPYGVVEKLWVAHDEEFIYFRLQFAEPRPFAGDGQSEWIDKYWANTRYILLDVDGDSQPDYYTNQISLRKGGFNNTYVVKLTDGERQTYLWYEGHAQWDNGPRGHFSPDGTQIEIRVPLEPLNIQTRTIGFQVQMSLRDGVKGPNEWTNDRYPSDDEFFLYNLDEGAKIEPATSSGIPGVTMHETNTPPEIDGALDDEVWQEAPVLNDFVLNRGSLRADVQTRAQVARDYENLYFAVRADEPQMDQLKTDAIEAEAKRVWRDDCIEVFIDYHNDDATYYHLGVTAAGLAAGQFGVSTGSRNVAIDLQPDVTTAYRHDDDGWTIEFAFPFSNLGVDPEGGDIWGLNICRARPGAREYSSWAGVQGRFAQPADFGDAIFPAASGLTVISRGMAARTGNARSTNVIRGTYQPPEDTTLAIAVSTDAGGDELFA